MPTLFLILVHPFRAAERLRQEPRWLVAFLLVAAGFVGLRLAWHPQLVESTLAALPATATAHDQAWAKAILDHDLLLRSVFLPLRHLAGMGVFAYLLYLLCASLNPPLHAGFKQVLALEIHAEVFNLMGGFAVWAVTSLAGGENSAGNGIFTLLTTTKIFTLWYVIAMAAGIAVVFGFSRLKASLLAATAWVVSVLFNAFLLQSVSTSMHFQV